MTIKNIHTKTPCGINIIALIMLIASLVNSSALYAKAGDTFIQGQLTYTIIDDLARLVSVKEASHAIGGDIIIPSFVIYSNVKYTVDFVPSNSFVGLQKLHSVTFQSKNIKILTGCFRDCPNLGSVTFQEDGEYSIGRGSFQDNPSMVGISLSPHLGNVNATVFPHLVNITENVFAGTGFKSVLLPTSLSSISQMAFSKCSNLKYVRIPNSVTAISKQVFWQCPGIEHVTLPSLLSTIGSLSFNCCSELTLPNIDVNNLDYLSNTAIIYLGSGLPSVSSSFYISSTINGLFLKPSLYETCRSSADWDKWYSKFHVTDSIPVTIPSDRSYITLCRDFDVDLRHTNDNLPSGVAPLKAYIVSGIDTDNNAVILQEITYVPSRLRSNEDGFKGYDEYVGVLLKGTPGYTYYYTIGEEDYTKGKDGQMTLEKALALSNAAVPTTTATFVGAYDPKYVTPEETVNGITYTTYGLKNNEFCKYSQAGYVPYNHAYLRIPTSSTGGAKPMLSMIFKNADGTTSIEQIKDDTTSSKSTKDAMYNLQGMKVDDNYHGIVIVNGHKYMKK